MGGLAEIVKKEVAWYASGGFNLKSFLLTDEHLHIYAVNVIDFPKRKRPPESSCWPASLATR